MGGKAAGETRVIDYTMSIHYGICHGPVDGLLGIYVKERDAWPGNIDYNQDGAVDPNIVSFSKFIDSLTEGEITPGGTSSVAVQMAPLPIDRPDLFGGNKKEGGVRGNAWYLPGDRTQILPRAVAARYGLEPRTSPAYRGIASVMFTGFENGQGFLWCQNNPYLPPAWFTVYRRSVVAIPDYQTTQRTVSLAPHLATIQRAGHPPDSNPAHMILECLTNRSWGMGGPLESMNVPSFEKCAQTFFDERFGISIIWNTQTTVEAFVSEILDHVQAVLYLDPQTGLMTLTAIRGDYDVDALPVFDPSNCDLENRKRRAWGETINEINVVWTNPANEEEETVTFHDLGNMAVQGGTVSETRNYYGIRNVGLATEVGARDIRSAAYPLFQADLVADRTGWKLKPGQVIKINWPEDGIVGMPVRIGKVDYGAPGSPTVKASIMEDIFGLETTDYLPVQEPTWEDPAGTPEPVTTFQAATVPYPMLAAAGVDLPDTDYPKVATWLLVAEPTPQAVNYELWGEVPLPNGDTTLGSHGSKNFSSFGTLSADIYAQGFSYHAGAAGLGAIAGPDEILPGTLVYIGTDETDSEIAMYNSFDGSYWTMLRGLYDTTPKNWPAGTPFWIVSNSSTKVDATERVAGSPWDYQFLTRTPGKLLSLLDAPVETVVLTDRPYLPFRPANVKVGGVGLQTKVYTSAPTSVEITWANRNRKTEDAVALKWDDPTVTPETNQVTQVEVWDTSDTTLLGSFASATATSWSFPPSMVSGYSWIKVYVYSERDGFESMQRTEQFVNFAY